MPRDLVINAGLDSAIRRGDLKTYTFNLHHGGRDAVGCDSYFEFQRCGSFTYAPRKEKQCSLLIKTLSELLQNS